MQDLTLFSIASQRNQWLSARSSALANNIANADTPGYRARDVPTFEAALASQVSMTRSNPDHMAPATAGIRTFEAVPRGSGVNKHSGNTVSLETELMKLGDVRSQHSMVTGVVGAFSRMLQSSVKV